MPVSSIAQILIRLQAIVIFLRGVSTLGGTFTTFDNVAYSTSTRFLMISPSIVLFVVAVLVWRIAPWLSRLMTRKSDGELSLGGVTGEDLCTAVLLGLGVYFIMCSFADVLGWIHFFAVNRMEGGFHMGDDPSYYDLTEGLLTLMAGVAIAMTCRTWARRLTPKSQNQQSAPPSP